MSTTPPDSGSSDPVDPSASPSPDAPQAAYGGSYGPPTTPITPHASSAPSPSGSGASPYGGSYGTSSGSSYGSPSVPPTPPPGSPTGPPSLYAPPPSSGWPQQQGGTTPWGGQHTPPASGQVPGTQTYGSPTRPSEPTFFNKLFDLSFSSFITPSIVKLVYQIGIVLILVTWLAYIIAGFTYSPLLGLTALVVGAVAALFYLVVFRIILEFYLAVIRVAEDVHELKNARSGSS